MTNQYHNQFDDEDRSGHLSAIPTSTWSRHQSRRGDNDWISLSNPQDRSYLVLDADHHDNESESDDDVPELLDDSRPAVINCLRRNPPCMSSSNNGRDLANGLQPNLTDGLPSQVNGGFFPNVCIPSPNHLNIRDRLEADTFVPKIRTPAPRSRISNVNSLKPKESVLKECFWKASKPKGTIPQLCESTTRDIVYRFVMPMLGVPIMTQIYKLTGNSKSSTGLWCILALFGINIVAFIVKLMFFRIPPRHSHSKKDLTKLLSTTGFQPDDKLAMSCKCLDKYAYEDSRSSDSQAKILDIFIKALNKVSARLEDLQPTRSVTVWEIGDELLVALLQHHVDCLRAITISLTRMIKCFELAARRIVNEGSDKRPLVDAEITFRREIRHKEQSTKFWLTVFLYALLQAATIYQKHQNTKISVAPVEVNMAAAPDSVPALLPLSSYFTGPMDLYNHLPQLSLPSASQISLPSLPALSLNSVPSLSLAELKARLFSVDTPLPPPVGIPAPRTDLTTVAGIQETLKRGAFTVRELADSLWWKTKEVKITPEVFNQLFQ
ncbi:hypothetical protein GGR57DRAFT_510434 [Xylariaceae sp. FL1272]|nr:hypothetical protein GGR57DRAFT_510434 [Xylariaceae sp. FL1272]